MPSSTADWHSVNVYLQLRKTPEKKTPTRKTATTGDRTQAARWEAAMLSYLWATAAVMKLYEVYNNINDYNYKTRANLK